MTRGPIPRRFPPTAGFFSKWYLLLGSYQGGHWYFIVIILISSLLNAVYFFRILERMYLGEADAESSSERASGSALLVYPVVVMAVLLVVLGLGSSFIVSEFIAPILSVF